MRSLPVARNAELIVERVLQKHLPSFTDLQHDRAKSLALLGLDSVAALRILVDLERETPTPLPEHEIEASVFANAQTLVALVESVLQQGTRP